jgi:hypothetical protein
MSGGFMLVMAIGLVIYVAVLAVAMKVFKGPPRTHFAGC